MGCLLVLLCIYTYSPKCNLFSPMLLVCMFSGLTICHWTTNACALLGKIISPTPSSTQFPVVLYVGQRPHGLYPIHFSMALFGVILVQLTFGRSCWPDFMGVAFDVTRRHNHSVFLNKSVWNSALQDSFCYDFQKAIYLCFGNLL